MAIISVEKVAHVKDDGRPPKGLVAVGARLPEPGTTLVEGPPLDLVFYAGKVYPELAPEKAIEKVLSELRTAAKAPRVESVAVPESVISGNFINYPSLYAEPQTISRDERIPAEWLPLLQERLPLVDAVLRSVGRVQVQSFVPSASTKLKVFGYELGLIIGTAFVVADGIAMTNSHVAKEFARASDGGYPFLKDLRGSYEPEILIDFSGVYARGPELYRVSKVLYLAPETEIDVALLKLEPSPHGSLPPPLALQTECPADVAPTRRIFVCGYPTLDDGDPRVPNLFRMLQVKRISLGEFLGEKPYNGKEWLFHNCTTLGGSSGSPLVDFETGTVWGLHAYGRLRGLATEGNLAEPMWRVCQIKEVSDVMKAAAPVSPLALAPLTWAASDGGQASRSKLQAVRPVSFVCNNDIAASEQFHPEWFAPDSAAHQIVKRAVASVGLIRLKGGSGRSSSAEVLGTGFMIADGVLITVNLNPAAPFEMKRWPSALTVEFASTVCEEPSRSFSVGEILLKDDNSHITLLRLEERRGTRLPPPLELQKTRPAKALTGHKIFVVGHPFQDSRAPDAELFNQTFPPPYGVKRVAPGLILKVKERGIVAHDCSTSAGDGGAPLVSLTTGKVLGIHIGGFFMKHNYGRPMWSVLAPATVREVLGPPRAQGRRQ